MRRNRFALRVILMAIFILCFSLSVLVQAATPSNNEVVIKTVKELKDAGVPLSGGTFIENGEALHETDLIMFNDKIAVAISVGTPNPWGYPPSSFLDAALMIDNSVTDPNSSSHTNLLDKVKDGCLKAGSDTIWDMEFLMDNWDSWGPDNSKPRAITVSDNIDFDGDGTGDGVQGIVSTRKFAHTDKTPMDVVTYYVLGNDDNFIRINTIVSNPTGGSTYGPLSTGYSLGNKGAYMFAPDPLVGAPYNKYLNTYNKDYSVSLIDLACEKADLWGSNGYKDTERKTTYEPGKVYNFEAIFRIDDEGSLEGTLEQLMTEAKAERVTVTGKVLDAATALPLKDPIIVVEKGEKTFTWVIGEDDGTFSFSLPKVEDMSTYKVYALKELYSPGQKTAITLNGKSYNAGALKLTPVEEITINVKNNFGKQIDARLELLGVTTPAVRYVAQTVFYTELDKIGVAKIPVAKGDYKIEVTSGAFFESLPFTLEGNTTTKKTASVVINKLIDPASFKWYSADLHHHSNKSDGSTLPINLTKSQLANGLNLIFTSDHDSIASNQEIAGYAGNRNAAYIPSLEVSPSWAHFNILPVETRTYNNMKNNNFAIDPYMLFPEMVKKVHDAGAVIIANHPYIAYGLFTAQENNAIPGGYSADFDLIEINGDIKAEKNQKALDKAMDLWTDSVSGKVKRYYLTGGSDTHDVLAPDMTKKAFSGKCRTYVNVTGALTPAKYLDALLKGNSYVTMGPILFADNYFGKTIKVKKGNDFVLSFDAMAVKGISKVEIFTSGKIVAGVKEFAVPSLTKESLSFTLQPTASTWYNIIVTDADGKKAISNPIWIDMK